MSRTAWLMGLAGLGLLVRVVLWALSEGSNDVGIWETFAQAISADGLRATYVRFDGTGPDGALPTPVFNHPPLAGLWAWACFEAAQWSGARFSMLLKLPGLLGELGTAALLWRVWSRRQGREAALGAVAAYALALAPILVSAYHGNTDAWCAFLILLAVVLFEERRPFGAGLVLAFALNVKLLPVFAVPALLAQCRDWKALGRLTAGLAVATVPFLPFLLTIPEAMVRNVLSYTPKVDFWGLGGLLLGAQSAPRVGGQATAALAFFVAHARYLLAAVVGAAAVLARVRRVDPIASATVGLALFLLVTPGFGVQYVMLVCPVLFACDVRAGTTWAWLAGLFIFVPYFFFVSAQVPWRSVFVGHLPVPAAMLGFAAWAFLASVVVRTLRGPSRA